MINLSFTVSKNREQYIMSLSMVMNAVVQKCITLAGRPYRIVYVLNAYKDSDLR